MTRRVGPHQEHLQDLLRDYRQRAGLRQVDVARALHQSQSYVSMYESGERRLDLLQLHDICVVLGVPLTDLVERFESSYQDGRDD